ncbi:hypothetical protein Tco_0452703 [Tanacetum coccineum]
MLFCRWFTKGDFGYVIGCPTGLTGLLVRFGVVCDDGKYVHACVVVNKRVGIRLSQLKLGLMRGFDGVLWINVPIRIMRPKLNEVLSMSDTQVITMKMEILLEPTSNKLMVERFDTSTGNPVKEILLKLNLPDHRILKDGGEVKEFQEICLNQAFKTKKQQQYEHVGPKVTSSQDGKVYKMAKRDYAWLMISRCSRSHIHLKEQAEA